MKFLTISLLLLTLVVSLPVESYWLEVFNTFRFQYLWLGLIFLLMSWLKKDKLAMTVTLILMLVNLYFLVPTWMNSDDVKDPDLKIILSNVLSSNHSYSKLVARVKETKPDIIVLLEYNRDWEKGLADLEKDYGIHLKQARSDNFGLAIYSKLPLLAHKVIVHKATTESMLLKFEVAGKPVTIMATHPLPPMGERSWSLRNHQLNELGDFLHKLSGPKVLLGDFNTVPWSRNLDYMQTEAGVKMIDSFNDTWNANLPPGFRIRLDHTYVSPDFLANIETLDSIDSDHLPVLIKLESAK